MGKTDEGRQSRLKQITQTVFDVHDETLKQLAESERKDREFRLEMANEVWRKVKGIDIPADYSEEDRLSIFERYYHRAVSQSQGE